MISGKRALYPLVHHTITGKHDGPHLLVLAGVHGDEYEPMTAARALAQWRWPDDLRGRLTVVPCVNMPAFQANSRCGPDGLDLARTCPGDPKGSITQQIAHEASKLIRDADYLIDMHTGGRALKMAPLSGYMLHRDPGIRKKQQEMARAFGLPIVWATAPNLDGRTLSVARDANVPAIYVEAGGGGEIENRIVHEYQSGCIRVMVQLGMIDRWEDPCSAHEPAFVLEDARTGSGVLQVQHPSPCAGIFISEAKLGVPIERGGPIGVVVDLASQSDAKVVAAETGVLVSLRSLPGVQPGDALAAIAVHHPGETS